MSSFSDEEKERRIRALIRKLEPEPGRYEACGVEDVDMAYPRIMEERPRKRPAFCRLRRRLVREYFEEIDRAMDDSG